MKDAFRVFFFALLIRTVYIAAFVDPAGLQAEDQIVFLTAAQSILGHGVLSVPPERVPGYPLFVALLSLPFGQNDLLLLAVQGVIDSMTCVFVGVLTFNVLGRGFYAAGLLAALNLNMVVLSAMVLTETLFLFLFTLFLYFLVRFANHLQTREHLLCVLFLCLATMVRSVTYLLLPCVVFGLLVWNATAGVTAKRAGIQFLSSILIMVALLGPQHLRNWQQYGSTSFVSQGGAALLGWVVPATYQYSGQGSYEQGQELARSRLDSALSADHLDSLPSNPFRASEYQSAVAKAILNELGAGSVIKAWGVGSAVNLIVPSVAFSPAVRAMEHPSFYGTAGRGIIEKLWNFVTDSNGVLYLLILFVGTATSLAFLFFAVFGWCQTLRGLKSRTGARNEQRVLVAYSLIVAYFMVLTGPIIGSKYRLPIEPIMMVYAIGAIYRFFPGIKRE
jgi:hypothetical protein